MNIPIVSTMIIGNRNWLGSPFADFEKAMLFDRDKEHVGWFEWYEKGNTQFFMLSKSPFLGLLPPTTPDFGQMDVNTYYFFEDGFTGPYPTEGQFIRVEVNELGKPKSEGRISGEQGEKSFKYRTFTVKNIVPIKDSELFEILPRSHLTLADFQYWTTINFDNAEKDNLNLILPLQIVSAPSNELGNGGLTAMRATFLQDDKQVVKSFNKGILSQIPDVFRKANPTYCYKAISTKLEESGLPKLCSNCKEVNLLTESNTSLGINLPIIHYESRYHLRQKLTSDVVSYQLSALICKPHISNDNDGIKSMEKSIFKARKRIEDSAAAFNLKPDSAFRIAESYARMNFVQNHPEQYLKGAENLLDGQIKSHQELFGNVMDNFADLMCIYDGLEFTMKIDGKNQKFKSSFYDKRLSRSSMIAYVRIRKLAGQYGQISVRKSELIEELGWNPIKMDLCLSELKNAGYIIILENETVIRLTMIGEFGAVFDELQHK